jgi:hypothetical protein
MNKQSQHDDLPSRLTTASKDCETAFEELNKLNSNNVLMLRLYGSFLVEAERKTKRG